MDVQVNLLAVVLAALSTMVVGSVWYSLPVFGKLWCELIGKKPKDLPQTIQPIVITVIVSFVSSYVLAHMAFLASNFYVGEYSFLQASLMTAFWLWLGFTAARFITHDAFEGRRKKLTLINISHELVTFLVMGLIIGLLQP